MLNLFELTGCRVSTGLVALVCFLSAIFETPSFGETISKEELLSLIESGRDSLTSGRQVVYHIERREELPLARHRLVRSGMDGGLGVVEAIQKAREADDSELQASLKADLNHYDLIRGFGVTNLEIGSPIPGQDGNFAPRYIIRDCSNWRVVYNILAETAHITKRGGSAIPREADIFSMFEVGGRSLEYWVESAPRSDIVVELVEGSSQCSLEFDVELAARATDHKKFVFALGDGAFPIRIEHSIVDASGNSVPHLIVESSLSAAGDFVYPETVRRFSYLGSPGIEPGDAELFGSAAEIDLLTVKQYRIVDRDSIGEFESFPKFAPNTHVTDELTDQVYGIGANGEEISLDAWKKLQSESPPQNTETVPRKRTHWLLILNLVLGVGACVYWLIRRSRRP